MIEKVAERMRHVSLLTTKAKQKIICNHDKYSERLPARQRLCFVKQTGRSNTAVSGAKKSDVCTITSSYYSKVCLFCLLI